MLAVFKPLQDILGDVGLVFTAQHDVHAGDFGDFLALELSVASRDHNQGVRILADEVADVLSALAVGKGGDAARVHDAHVGHFALGHGLYAVAGKQRLHGSGLREVELAAQRLEFHLVLDGIAH